MPFLGHPIRLLYATAQTFALAHVISHYGISFGHGWGPSMLPTFLVAGEWFITDKRCRRGRGVGVGDCVVYAIPVEPGEEGVKRVMGMPGDYVLLNSPPPSAAFVAAAAAADGGAGVGVSMDRAGRSIGSENMIQVSLFHLGRGYGRWKSEIAERNLTSLLRYQRVIVILSVTTYPGREIVATSAPFLWLLLRARPLPSAHSPA